MRTINCKCRQSNNLIFQSTRPHPSSNFIISHSGTKYLATQTQTQWRV